TDAFSGAGHRLEVYGDEGTLLLENREADYISGFKLFISTREGGAFREIVPAEAATFGRTGEDGRIAATASIARRLIDTIRQSDIATTPSVHDGVRVQALI